MGLPKFPKLPMPPPRDILIGLLLQTIVFEEQALAAVLNAEAEKVQEMVEAGFAAPVTAEEAIEINKSVAEVIRAAADKEERLLRKLQLLTSFPKKKRFMSMADDDSGE